jgi:hypothetical protein
MKLYVVSPESKYEPSVEVVGVTGFTVNETHMCFAAVFETSS